MLHFASLPIHLYYLSICLMKECVRCETLILRYHLEINLHILSSCRCSNICGHRTVKVPHPVRSAKSSTVSPSQYCGGGPRGNPGCCSSILFYLVHEFPFCRLERSFYSVRHHKEHKHSLDLGLLHQPSFLCNAR
jgi:hypothetical protein